jgi:hypothetical protein
MADPLALELEAIRRGISSADLQRQRAGTPRRIGSVTQGLAQLAEAFVARRAGTQAEERLAAFQTKAETAGEEDTTRILEASKGDRKDLARALLQSTNPAFRTAGASILAEKPTKAEKPATLKDAAGFQRFTSGPNRGERVFPGVVKPEDEPKPQAFIQLQKARDTASTEGRTQDASEIQALIDKQSTIVGRTAEDVSAGTPAQVGKQVEAADFFDQQASTIADVIIKAKKDPLLLGIGGTVRKAGQTLLGVAESLTKLIGGKNIDSAVERARTLLPETELTIQEQDELFNNPDISKLRLFENSIGLARAKLLFPTGRIPVEVIKRAINDSQLTGFVSQQDAINRLTEIQRQFEDTSSRLRSRAGIEKNPIIDQEKPSEMSDADFEELHRLRQEQGG